MPVRCASRIAQSSHAIFGRSETSKNPLVLVAYDTGSLPALFQIGNESVRQSIVRPSQHFQTGYGLKMKPQSFPKDLFTT